jgi:peptide/nickel transport system substrate-binding protein
MKVIRGQVPGTRSWGAWYCCNRTQDGQYYRDNSTPLLNIKVRQALNKAIDRDALQKAFFSRGERMHINQMHQTWPGWDTSWERRFNDLYGFNLEGAKRLLAEAGYGPASPLKTNIAVRASVVIPNAPDVVEAIAGMWRKAGVEVELIQTDIPTQTTEVNAFRWTNHMVLDASATHQVSAWPNRTSDLQRHPLRGGAAYFDADTNRVVAALERELDSAKQGPLMREAGELMFTRFGSVPLFFIPVEAVVNPQFVSDWVFPGPTFGTWSHLENIKAVRQ